eukprot:6209677-Pleurochrysis_carterae.AAC.1
MHFPRRDAVPGSRAIQQIGAKFASTCSGYSLRLRAVRSSSTAKSTVVSGVCMATGSIECWQHACLQLLKLAVLSSQCSGNAQY